MCFTLPQVRDDISWLEHWNVKTGRSIAHSRTTKLAKQDQIGHPLNLRYSYHMVTIPNYTAESLQNFSQQQLNTIRKNALRIGASNVVELVEAELMRRKQRVDFRDRRDQCSVFILCAQES